MPAKKNTSPRQVRIRDAGTIRQLYALGTVFPEDTLEEIARKAIEHFYRHTMPNLQREIVTLGTAAKRALPDEGGPA